MSSASRGRLAPEKLLELMRRQMKLVKSELVCRAVWIGGEVN